MSFLLVRQPADPTVLHVIPKRTVTTGKVALKERITYRDEQHGGCLEREIVHMGSKENCTDLMKIMISKGQAAAPDASKLLQELPSRRERRKNNTMIDDDDSDYSDKNRPSTSKLRIKVEADSPVRKGSKRVMKQEGSRGQKKKKSNAQTGERKVAIPDLELSSGESTPNRPPKTRRGSSPTGPVVAASVPTPTTAGSDSALRDSIANLTKLVQRQSEMIEHIQENVGARPYPKYTGPQYIPKEAVIRFSAEEGSNIAFFRQLMDAVSLPNEIEKKVEDRNRMRNQFVKEQVRLLRCHDNNEIKSLYLYLRRKYNFLVKERKKKGTVVVRPKIDGLSCDDNASGDE